VPGIRSVIVSSDGSVVAEIFEIVQINFLQLKFRGWNYSGWTDNFQNVAAVIASVRHIAASSASAQQTNLFRNSRTTSNFF
jgi:hypothetical protein